MKLSIFKKSSKICSYLLWLEVIKPWLFVVKYFNRWLHSLSVWWRRLFYILVKKGQKLQLKTPLYFLIAFISILILLLFVQFSRMLRGNLLNRKKRNSRIKLLFLFYFRCSSDPPLKFNQKYLHLFSEDEGLTGLVQHGGE